MSKDGNRITICERCRGLKRHHARMCCKACYNKLADGRDPAGLAHYPTLTELMMRSTNADRVRSAV